MAKTYTDNRKTQSEKKPERPNPEMLGTGTVRTAAERAIEHNRKLCEATGGYYNPKDGSCN